MSEKLPSRPFRWGELAELGVTEFTLRRWLKAGLVRRPFRGVYCPTALDDDLALRARCAGLVIPDSAVVCDRSAAWLWGIDVHDPDERFEVPDLEVAVSPGSTPPQRRYLRGAERDLAEDEKVSVHGVPVTTPVRTALDVASLRGRWNGLATLDAFMRKHALTHRQLQAGLVRLAGRRGVTQARELCPLASPLAESPGESWTRGAIIDAGLPPPQLQVEVKVGDVLMARLDLAYRRLKIAVEYDGEDYHGPDQEQHDRDRRTWLRERGWHVIVLRKHQLAGAAREAWLHELGTVIAERSAKQKRVYARSRTPWVPSC